MTVSHSTAHAICACGKPIAKFFKSGKPHKWCAECRSKKVRGTERHTVTSCYCGKKLEQGKTGPIRRFCSHACRHSKWQEERNIPLPAKLSNCAVCSAEIGASSKSRIYCSAKCNGIAQRRKSGALPRDQYEAGRKNANNWFCCEQCGKESHRKLSGTNESRGSKNRFCSMKCRIAAAAALRPPEYSPCYGLFCSICRNPFISKVEKNTCSSKCELLRRNMRHQEYVRKRHRLDAKVIKCEQCECVFSPLYGASHATLCVPCADERARVNKRIAKMKRKAVMRGVESEAVNPYVIFTRDKWKCRLCGIATPRAKRGTHADDAPELDHIIPISKGGPHTYLNTQCACRKCNQLKSDKPLGQMLLIG